jgi:class 3 adenylate cyclase/tetratricopeptide (TPR) repeat protein
MNCPSCGRENPEGFQFCGFCRASLEQVPSGSITEERKIVSVLFCDLVGFTARSDEADPEDVRATLRPFHQMLRQEIERYGGTVEKFIGDAVMAVFGAPIAHEDDAERAVRAGLRILETIPELTSSKPELELSVRIGINTGEAVVALGARPEEGEGIVSGDVVNTASRLQGAAPVGGIAVGELTYRITKDLFDYEELEPVTLKGKSEPIAIWRAVAARSRFGVDVRDESTPFVGREEERNLLQGAFRRAVREFSVQLVTVIGEPGVGKSRLVGKLFSHIDEIDELVAWRQGRCLPYGEGITFWALGEIVKAQAGILESDSPDVASAKLEQAVGAVIEDQTDRRWTLERLGPLLGLGTKTSQGADDEESFAAWRGFLEAVAGDDVLVAVFEDLHWADEKLLQFIEHLVEWSSGVALVVVCTARPELFERHPNWGAGGRNLTTISLSPLSDTETSLLISSLLAHAVLPAEVHALVLERSGGNPLYAEEFIRMLKDRGILEEHGRSLSLTPGVEIPFPDSVQALIAARLDTLSPERKALLQDAAVIGKVFWAGAVSSIGDREAAEVREGLHELARKELVRPSRTSSVKDEAEYAFWHALVRDVAYSQIPRAARSSKHRSAGAWIERVAGERVADHAEVLAYHYAESLELAEASGDTADEELIATARRYLTLAGDRAMRLSEAVAEAYYRRALDLTSAEDPMRAELLLKTARAAHGVGRLQEAEEDLGEAIRLHESRSEEIDAAKAMTELCLVVYHLGDTPRSTQLLEEATAILQAHPPGPDLASAAVEMAGDRAVVKGDYADALRWADLALDLADRFELDEQRQGALSHRGMARAFAGDLEGGLEDMRRALDLGLHLGLGRRTTITYNNLGVTFAYCESAIRGLEVFLEGFSFADRRGLSGEAAFLRGSATTPLFDAGRWDEVLEIAAKGAAWAEAQGMAAYPDPPWNAARVHHYRRQEVSGSVEDLLARAKESSSEERAVILATAALIGLESSHSTVFELIGQLARDKNPGVIQHRGVLVSELARICVATGNIGFAAQFATETGWETARSRAGKTTAQALIAEVQGDPALAERLFREAADRWEQYGSVFERAMALLGSGRCLVQLGRADGRARLHEARETFEALEARRLLDETDDWLAQATALSS